MTRKQPYQSADGDWIYFDGETKHRYSDEDDAQSHYWREEMSLDTQSAELQWEERVNSVIALARQIVEEIASTESFLTNNGIQAAVTALDAGEKLGDSNLTKERAQDVLELIDAFSGTGGFLSDTLSTSGNTVEKVIMVVYN